VPVYSRRPWPRYAAKEQAIDGTRPALLAASPLQPSSGAAAPSCTRPLAAEAACARSVYRVHTIAVELRSRRHARKSAQPLLRGVFRHPEVQYPASLMGKNDEDEQDPEGRRRHGEKINGRGLCKVIHQKGPPSLGSRFARPRQIFGHRGLRHLNSQNSQLEQFSVNPRCTPQGVAWCMRRMRSRRFAAISGLPGRRRDFLVQCQAKALRCQRRTVSGCTM
jgi:hypothetical protein